MSELDKALRMFEVAEANLEKLEKLSKKVLGLTPSGIAFGNDPKYEDAVRAYEHILDTLPKIDGWKPQSIPEDLNTIAQMRLDAQEIDEIGLKVETENGIEEHAKEIREYRFRFDRKRRALIREAINGLIEEFIELSNSLYIECKKKRKNTKLTKNPKWQRLNNIFNQIDTLIGSSVPRSKHWQDINRHLYFGMVHDLNDIVERDWPEISADLRVQLFADDEPLPLEIDDLSDIVKTKPTGSIATELLWKRLSPEGFERLIFALISNEKGYENPNWLMPTSAPDRGRDLSVTRVINDPLSGVRRERVIIQCKHWLSKSISTSDISNLRDQVKLWEPLTIDELIICTSGRFSADAVTLVEKNNQSDTSLKIQMWPNTHLERLLAARPALIAEFGLR